MGADVVLVNPPLRTANARLEHLGLAYLAAALRRVGIATQIVDGIVSRTGIRGVVDTVVEAAPRLVGITAMQPQGRALIAIAEGVRRKLPGVHVTAGGHFPTFCYDQLFRDVPALDSLVRGEGDAVFVDLVQRVLAGEDWRGLPGVSFRQDGTVISNPPGPLLANLDDLPFPARDTAAMSLARYGRLCVSTSRGCYMKCTFCSVRAFYATQSGPGWRPRSPENVVEEMAILARDYECTRFRFNDDTFIGPGAKGIERAHAIADEMLRRGLRCQFEILCRADNVERELMRHLQEAGLSTVALGIESGSQRQLDRYRKGTTIEDNRRAIAVLRDLGIECRCFLVTFDPDSTPAEFLETLRFMAEPGIVGVTFDGFAAIPYDGTELYEQLHRQGRLRGSYLKGYSYLWRHPALGMCVKAIGPIGQILRTVRAPFQRSSPR